MPATSKTPPPDGAADLDPASLRLRVSQTKTEMHRLTAERSGLAVASLRGIQSASTRIAEIDIERQRLVAHIETLEQAFTVLVAEKRAEDLLRRNR